MIAVCVFVCVISTWPVIAGALSRSENVVIVPQEHVVAGASAHVDAANVEGIPHWKAPQALLHGEFLLSKLFSPTGASAALDRLKAVADADAFPPIPDINLRAFVSTDAAQHPSLVLEFSSPPTTLLPPLDVCVDIVHRSAASDSVGSSVLQDDIQNGSEMLLASIHSMRCSVGRLSNAEDPLHPARVSLSMSVPGYAQLLRINNPNSDVVLEEHLHIVRVDVVALRRRFTTFEAEVSNERIYEHLAANAVSWTIIPQNASMGVYFVCAAEQHGASATDSPLVTLAVQVVRKPPTPRFVFRASIIDHTDHSKRALVRDIVVASGRADSITFHWPAPPPPSALRSVFSSAASSTSAPTVPTVSLVLEVAFEERSRAVEAVFPIAHYNRDVAQRIRDTTEPVELSAKNASEPLHLMVGYSASFHDAVVYILQPHPIQDLQLVVVDGSGRVTFVEEEFTVPYIPRDSPLVPFGWHSALPLFGPVDGDAATLFVYYTPRPAKTPVELLEDWLRNGGGSWIGVTSQVASTKAALASVASATTTYVAAKALNADDVLFSMPLNLVMDSGSASMIPFIEDLAHSSLLLTRCGSTPDETLLMQLAVFSLTQPESVLEGIKWYPFIDTLTTPVEREEEATLRTAKQTMPAKRSWRKGDPFFPTLHVADLQVTLEGHFPITTGEIARKAKLYVDEYGALIELHPWLRNRTTELGYIIRRSVIDRFAIRSELTNGFFLAPFLNLLPHDDSPTCQLHMNYSNKRLELRATKALRKGEELVHDYGSAALTKGAFFARFGFLPLGASDAAEIEVEATAENVSGDHTSNATPTKKPFVLTMLKGSRQPILDVCAKRTPASSSWRACLEWLRKELRSKNEAILQSLMTFPQRVKVAGSVHPTIQGVSSALLRSAQRIIIKHLDWLSDEIQDSHLQVSFLHVT